MGRTLSQDGRFGDGASGLHCGAVADWRLPDTTPPARCAHPGLGQPRRLIGAQVWIEPGQTPEQIDGWFLTLAESGMLVARLFLMWNTVSAREGGPTVALGPRGTVVLLWP